MSAVALGYLNQKDEPRKNILKHDLLQNKISFVIEGFGGKVRFFNSKPSQAKFS